MNIDVTIGWTISDLPRYSSFDGYQTGERQHTETITVEWTNPPEVADDAMLSAIGATRADAEALRIERIVEALAEACFNATNHPFPHGLSGLAAQVHRLIGETGYRGAEAHYSLSVGDTVTVGEVTLACDRLGWKRVSLAEVTV